MELRNSDFEIKKQKQKIRMPVEDACRRETAIM